MLTGAIAGGFIIGLTGFGMAPFAWGFFLTVMPPVQAVAVTLGIVSGQQGLWLRPDPEPAVLLCDVFVKRETIS